MQRHIPVWCTCGPVNLTGTAASIIPWLPPGTNLAAYGDTGSHQRLQCSIWAGPKQGGDIADARQGQAHDGGLPGDRCGCLPGCSIGAFSMHFASPTCLEYPAYIVKHDVGANFREPATTAALLSCWTHAMHRHSVLEVKPSACSVITGCVASSLCDDAASTCVLLRTSESLHPHGPNILLSYMARH